MGGVQAKNKPSMAEEGLREKVKILERDIREIMEIREIESQAFDHEMMVFVLKEAEWRGEREKLKDEIKRVKEEEEEERRRRGGTCRDEAVERWKKLYLAIKVELDHLIIHNSTHLQGDWRPSSSSSSSPSPSPSSVVENEELKRRVKEKEETIEILQARLVSMEQEEMRKEREMDILRQSLRIMCHNNNNNLKMIKKKKTKTKTTKEESNPLIYLL